MSALLALLADPLCLGGAEQDRNLAKISFVEWTKETALPLPIPRAALRPPGWVRSLVRLRFPLVRP
jgi:hypothetical protein